jgi:hypothetical protein
VRALLAVGADTGAKDRNKLTPRDVAALRGAHDVVAVFSAAAARAGRVVVSLTVSKFS